MKFVFFLQKMIFFLFCCLKLDQRYDRRDLLVNEFLLKTQVSESMLLLVNLVTLTMMILLTARACEVVVSD